MLGSGATACSALAALSELGVTDLTVAARRHAGPGRAATAAHRMGLEVATLTWRPGQASSDTAVAESLVRSDLVISTLPARAADTLAGPLATALEHSGGPAPGAVMLDVVYAPWPTPLASAWSGAGGATAPGWLMLLHQAVPQVTLMTGRTPPTAPMRRALHEALAAGELTRRQCYEVFARVGIDPGGNRGPHLLRALGGEGLVVQGARRGGEEVFRLVGQLPVPQRELDGDEALAELATRYVGSHGPATLDDLAWWTHLGRGRARRALALGTGYHRDGDHYVPDWQSGITSAEMNRALARTVTLPPFDEYLLGYTDRTGILPDELRPQVLTMNGLSWHFVVRRGVVRGRAER